MRQLAPSVDGLPLTIHSWQQTRQIVLSAKLVGLCGWMLAGEAKHLDKEIYLAHL